MSQNPDLEDARAVLDRARRHHHEFSELTSPKNLWPMTEARDRDTGEWVNQLHLERKHLVLVKPVIADCANNLISTLDHVAAAIARANGHERDRHLYFPLAVSDEVYAAVLARVEKKFGGDMTRIISEARAKHRGEIPHIVAAKEISNTGKHWKLTVSNATAHGVAWNEIGRPQQIVQIPADAFTHTSAVEYYRGTERMPRVPVSIMIGLTLDGLDNSLPSSPDTVLRCAVRYVEGMIEAVSKQESSFSD